MRQINVDKNQGFNVSDKYVPVNTETVLQTFKDAGYTVTSMSQARVLNPAKQGFQKHMIRLTHDDINFNVGGLRPELILRNSYDGSSAFKLSLGIYRFICSNGLEVGYSYENHRVVHKGTDVLNKVLEACERIKSFYPQVQRDVVAMQNSRFSYEQALDLVSALNPVLNKELLPQSALTVRRPDDKETDAFTVMNVVQENILRGAYSYVQQDPKDLNHLKVKSGRRIKSIDVEAKVNKALWDKTLQLIDL